MAIITDGSVRYRIICVKGGSKNTLTANSNANNATCDFKSWTGGNAQVWRVQQAGSTNYELIRYEYNDYALEIRNGSSNNKEGYAPQTQKTVKATNNAQRWFLEPAYEVDYNENDEPYETSTLRTANFNGYAYQAYRIHCMGSTTSRVLTCGYKGKATATITTKDITDDGQLFLFIPDSLSYGAIPVPASGAVRTSATGKDLTGVIVASSATLYPSFTSGNKQHQGRWHYRTRGVDDDDDDLSSWSYWTCIDSSKGANDANGLGTNVAALSLPVTKRGTRMVSNAGVALALGDDYDLIEAAFAVRGFVASYKDAGNLPAHSSLYNFTVKLVKPITLSAAVITALPEGIIISWETTWERTCSTKVTCAQLLKKAVSSTAEVIEVPSSNLCKVPVAGQTYKLTFEVTTGDGATVKQTLTATVVSEGGSSMTMTCTDDSHIATFEVNKEDARAWLVVPRGNRDRFVEFDGTTGTGKTTFTIPVPLGVTYKIWASHVDTANETWASKVFEFDPIVERPRAMHFTSRDLSRDMALCFNSEEGGPEHSSSYAREQTEVVTAGGPRPFYGLGRTTKASHKVKGVFVSRLDYATQLDNFEWLTEAGHIYFRTARGFWAQGVVDSCDIDRTTATKHAVNVSFNEEEW